MTYIIDRGENAVEREHADFQEAIGRDALCENLSLFGIFVEALFGCDIPFCAKTGTLAVTTITHAERVLTTLLMCVVLYPSHPAVISYLGFLTSTHYSHDATPRAAVCKHKFVS